jgi:hypothetical protein
MVGMGLCQRNLYNMRNDDFGFSAHNLVALNVYTEAEGYKQAQAAEFYDKLRRTTAALPGVQAVTLAWDLPLFGSQDLPIQVPATGGAISPHDRGRAGVRPERPGNGAGSGDCEPADGANLLEG